MNALSFFEWSGSAFAIIGSILLAVNAVSMPIVWLLWTISNVLLSILFFNVGQTGLLYLQIGIFVISVIGYTGYKLSHIHKVKSALKTVLLSIVLSVILINLYIIQQNLVTEWNTQQVIEWTGSMTTLAASALMSSQVRLKNIAWIFWTIGSGLLVYLTIQTSQNGVLALQATFLTINLIGIFNNFIKPFIFRTPAVKTV